MKRTNNQLYHFILSFPEVVLREWYNTCIIDPYGDHAYQTIRENTYEQEAQIKDTLTLETLIQAANYIQIAQKNPQTRFALYTKNPRFIAEAIAKGYEKPANLVIVFSSLFLNAQARAPYPFIDKVFTVYETEEKAPNGINCGARSCFTCQRCYRASKPGEVEQIAELLK